MNTNEIPNQFTLIVFGVKGTIYYVAIAKVILSHVKISSFCAKAHLIFHWCLYNKYMYCIQDNLVIRNDLLQTNKFTT